MPNIKSAKKRVEVAERNRLRNVAVKSAIKTATKKVYDAIKSEDTAQITDTLNKVYSVIDKAVVKGILHRNTAARKKSRISDHANRKFVPSKF